MCLDIMWFIGKGNDLEIGRPGFCLESVTNRLCDSEPEVSPLWNSILIFKVMDQMISSSNTQSYES